MPFGFWGLKRMEYGLDLSLKVLWLNLDFENSIPAFGNPVFMPKLWNVPEACNEGENINEDPKSNLIDTPDGI